MRIIVRPADVIFILSTSLTFLLGYICLPFLPEGRIRAVVVFAFAFIAIHVMRFINKKYHQSVLVEFSIGKSLSSDRPCHFSLSTLLLLITLFAVFLGAISWSHTNLF